MEEQGWITDRRPGERFPTFTRGNAADVLPDPVSPLGWTFLWEPAITTGARDGFIDYGLLDWDEFEDPSEPDTFGMFGGYFFNPLSLVRLMGARIPGASPEIVDKAFFDERDDVPPYEAQPWHHSEEHAAKLTETLAWVMSAESFPRVDAEKEQADRTREERPDLSSLWEGALLARARSLVPIVQQMFDTSIFASLGASVGPAALAGICEAVGDPTLTVRALGGIEVDSAKPSFAMWELSRLVASSGGLTEAFESGVDGLVPRIRAIGSDDSEEFLRRFDEFTAEHGSRGPNEWDLRAKVWETHPELALAAIDRMRLSDDASSPRVRHLAAVRERDQVLSQLGAKLAGDAESSATLEAAVRSSAVFLAARERYKTNCIKVIHEMRMALLEFARRKVEAGSLDDAWQIFMCRSEELDVLRFVPGALLEELRSRQRRFGELSELEPPFVVHRQVPPLSQWRRRRDREATPAGPGDVLPGTAGSGGVATGTARIITDPSDPAALQPGDVLVAPNTDPSWTPLFVPAAAVVVGVGAIGSHAMIISRELGIPCVASVEDAIWRIPDGATVTVDGNAGTVTVH